MLPTRGYKPQKAFFLKQFFDKICFLSNGIRDLAPHWNVSPFVRTAGIPSQIQFRVKKNVIHFSELSKVRGLGLLIEKLTIWSKNLPVEGTEGAYCGIQISPAIRFEAANCRWKWQNYFENLERQFVSKFDVQETPYGYKPKFAPRLIIQICARSALSLITWLLYFFLKGEGESKINGRWSPREIVRI